MARFDNNEGWVISRGDERSASGASERAMFYQRTYLHLALALLVLIGLEYVLLLVIDPSLPLKMVFDYGWLGIVVVLLAFMGATYLAQTWARSDASRAMQYLGLGLYVVAEAGFLLPLLLWADRYFLPVDGQITFIWQAAIMMLCVVAGLTISAFIFRNDFSYRRSMIVIGLMLVLGLIIALRLADFSLGMFFSFAVGVLLATIILWETCQLMYHYNSQQYVAAALELKGTPWRAFFLIVRFIMMVPFGWFGGSESKD